MGLFRRRNTPDDRLGYVDHEALPGIGWLMTKTISQAELRNRSAGVMDALEAGDDFIKPRKVDLMIAAVASVNQLPLYTRHPKDFTVLDNVLTVVAV